jgi:serine protease
MKKTFAFVIIVMLLAVTVVTAASNTNENGKVMTRVIADTTPFGEKGFDKTKYVQDEIIVKFKGDEKPFRVIKVPEGKVLQEIGKYKKRDDIIYAEPNYIAYALLVPNDPYYPYQWHLDNPVYNGIQMEEAWDLQTGNSNIIVAVIDTGVAYEDYVVSRREAYYLAPDLAETSFVPGYDFVNDDTHPNDDNSHGTHVTGTIAQSTNNALGVAGIAFNTSIMPIKVLDSTGAGTYADVADGIYFAADNGVKVISLSLGGSVPSDTLESAVAYAYNNGVTVVAAAGNDGLDTLVYPAAYDVYVIAVGATRYDETLAYYSNYGPSLDLVAPGGDLNVDQNGDGYNDGVLQNTFNPTTKDTSDFGYWFFQGTSMATPHVSGVAALLIANGIVGPDNIKDILQSTAEDLGSAGRDDTYGWGLVDAYAALQATLEPVVDTTTPTISIESPADGSVTNSQTVSFTVSDNVDVNEVTIVVTINGAHSTVFDPALHCTTGTISVPCSYTETGIITGSNIITVDANDTSENSAITESTMFTYDVTPPGITNATGNTAGTTGEAVTIEATITDNVDVAGATVYYTPIGGSETSVAMVEGLLDVWSASIPVAIDQVGIITYYIVAEDVATNTARDPLIGSYNITVTDNDVPIADAGSDQTVVVNTTVTFDGSGSTDNIGIVSYIWDFDDGNTGSGETTTHIYEVSDTYTVTLTVSDATGNTATDTALVTATEALLTMHVASIDMSATKIRLRGWYTYATSLVTIVDAEGNSVEGAMVYGSWSGLTTDSDSGLTDINGQVSLDSDLVKNADGTFTFTVTDVVLDGWTYDSTANVEISDSITV